MDGKLVEVSVISAKDRPNKILDNILNSINTYLIRNNGSVSDFNLIRDVVERNTDSIDEEINSQIPIPLYLGLMGTMLGIIIGLFFIPSIDSIVGNTFYKGDQVTLMSDGQKATISSIKTDEEIFVITENKQILSVKTSDISKPSGVDILLGGVKIAMISSFIGLLLTVLLSGWIYKIARIKFERDKNKFYTFLQTELIPVMASDQASVMRSLELTLNQFNGDFGQNARSFNKSFGNITKVLGEMKDISANFTRLINEISKLNLVKLSQINADLLQKINLSAQGLDSFNQYLSHIDKFIDNASNLNQTLLKQLNRTESIEAIASTISTNVTQNEKLIEYLDAGLLEVDKRKQIMSDAVIDVDETLKKSLDELEKHTAESIIAIRNLTIKEEGLLDALLTKDRGNLEKLKNLDNLKVSMERLLENSSEQNIRLSKLNDSIKEMSTAFRENKLPTERREKGVIRFVKYTLYGTGALVGGYLVIDQLYMWIVQLLDYLF